jgi:hypothetical protein
MVTEISSEQILLDLLRPIINETRVMARRCESFNALPNIPWRQREFVRMVEGRLDGIDQAILEFIDARWAENSPLVEAFIEELWGEE